MKTQWYKGLDTDQKDEIIAHYKGSVLLRKRLTEMLEDKMEGKERELMADSAYEVANWAYKQADAQGYKRAIKEILSLIE